jgi:cytochrome P450
MAVLIAGRDTTAATLSWTIYELSNYPAVVKRLRNEILSTVGARRTPTYEDLKAMTYLTHTINETLRLYPAVPYNLRAAVQDTTLPGMPGQPDIGVLKDDVVTYSPLAMQRRRDLYPPMSEKFADPAIFSPDRWDNWTPKAWNYIPFNGGPRICVGQNFAMTEMAFMRTCSSFNKYMTRLLLTLLPPQWYDCCRSMRGSSTEGYGNISSRRLRLLARQVMASLLPYLKRSPASLPSCAAAVCALLVRLVV